MRLNFEKESVQKRNGIDKKGAAYILSWRCCFSLWHQSWNDYVFIVWLLSSLQLYPFIFSWGVMQYLLLLLSILKKACLMNIIHSNDVVPALSLRSKNKLRGYAWLKGLKALLLVLNENHNSINVQFKRTTFDHNHSHLSWPNRD